MARRKLGESGWLIYNHYNLDDSKQEKEDQDMTQEEARRRAINPWLGSKPHDLNENLDEATGSAWMFYNHYNPELLKAMQSVLTGSQVEDVVNDLIETDPGSYKEERKRKLLTRMGHGAIQGATVGGIWGGNLKRIGQGALAGAAIGGVRHAANTQKDYEAHRKREKRRLKKLGKALG